MLVYDWEIFKHNSLLGALNIETDEIIQLWDINQIKKYIQNNLNEVWIRL
jgi:hypothetical protein